MKLYVGITDFDWFGLHASKEFVEEVNFWRPSPQATFKVLQRGEPFLFKLHAPRNYIVGEGGSHELSNGLLLRSDLHTLFDQHYVTIEPNKKTLIVSRRIREQFENGRDYYKFTNEAIKLPNEAAAFPSHDSLSYHYDRFSELEYQQI